MKRDGGARTLERVAKDSQSTEEAEQKHCEHGGFLWRLQLVARWQSR